MGKKKMFMKTLDSVGPVPPVPYIYTTNLVASYSFDTDFSDYTGNNPLTAFGGATAGVTGGKVSDCAELDGNSDYTIAVDSDDFSFTNGTNDLPFSISFWANFQTHSSNPPDASWIITKRDASTNEEYQVTFFDNSFQFWLFSQGGNSAYVTASLPFTPITGGTTWQHFTVTYDGSQTFSGIKMYIDGVSQTLTDSSVGAYLGMINGSEPVNIGSQGWNPTQGEFDGKLDEFHIWKNRELTQSEVTDIYNTENSGNSILPLQIPLANIISEYKFEDNTLDTVGTNNGTATDLTYASGLVGKTGVFNGTSSKVDTNTNNLIGGKSQVSFSCLFKNTTTVGIQPMYANWVVSGDRVFIIRIRDGQLMVLTVTGTDTIVTGIFFDFTDINIWHHIVFTYDGSTMRMYLDGIESNFTFSQSGLLRDGVSNDFIGNYLTNYFSGSLDCVRIWDKTLTQTEITLIATDELNGIDINPVIPLANIISEYKFENNVLDTVGTNDGTATGITYEAGTVGQRGVFNGSSSFVSVPNNTVFNFTEGAGVDKPFSISLLATFDTTNNNSALVNKYSAGSNAEFSLIIFGSKLNMGIFESDNWTDYISREYDFTRVVGQVYHISMTYDGSKSANGIKFYINGLEVVSTDISVGSYTGLVSNTAPILIGKRTLGTQHPHDGTLDCVRIWSKELTQAEITEIATAELNGIDINP